MISIRFNNLFFVSLSALSNYIVTVYGSWAQVPENHPDIAIVNALTGHNMDYYTEVDGRLEPHYPRPLAEPDIAVCKHCGLESAYWDEEPECTCIAGHTF